MKKFKDIDLTTIPEPVADILKALIPENADVEFDFSEQGFGFLSAVVSSDDVKDSCSFMGCEDCYDCPLDRMEAMSQRVAAHSEICNYLNGLYAAKNADYGNSFGDTYADLGIVSAITRITDKINRLKSLCQPGVKAQITDESIRDTLLDLANYAIMTVVEMDAQKGGK